MRSAAEEDREPHRLEGAGNPEELGPNQRAISKANEKRIERVDRDALCVRASDRMLDARQQATEVVTTDNPGFVVRLGRDVDERPPAFTFPFRDVPAEAEHVLANVGWCILEGDEDPRPR